MLKCLKLLIFAIVVHGSLAYAGTDNPYNGKWTVKFDGEKLANSTGTVVIMADQGTWKIAARSNKNPCVGFEAPVAVKLATDDELVLM